MAHNIATINGKHSIFTGRNQGAWHKLGVTIDGCATWQDAIELAGLNWNVEKRSLYDGNGQAVPVWGMFRDTDNQFLGSVGERYQGIQNADAFAWVDALIGDNGAHYDSAGALGNGEVIFCSAHLPSAGFEVVEGDTHQTYLLFKTSHDGSLSAVCKLTDVRTVCQNTLNAALRTAGAELKIKHTRNAADRMEQARKLITSGQKTAELIRDKMRLLSQKKVTRESMESIFKRLFPTSDNGDMATKTKNNIADILNLYEYNDNNAFPIVRGTAYNLLNAVTEYTDKLRTAKGGIDIETARAESALFGSGEKFKETAFDVIYQAASAMPDMVKQTYTQTVTIPTKTDDYFDRLSSMIDFN